MALPAGPVTFVFTDIEGSTTLAHELGDTWVRVLDEHNRAIRDVIARHGGVEVQTEGDAFFVVFEQAPDAIAACLDMQRALAAFAFSHGRPVRVRIGMHTGEAHVVGDNYVGVEVHEAARVGSAAHGGQVLVSQVTADLARDALPDGASLRDLGPHVLKDFPKPRPLYQLCHADLPETFPPLRTLSAVSHNLPAATSPIVGRGAELESIQRLLLGDARLVTLTGPGGIGKTRLAQEASWSLLAYFRGGVWFAPMAGVDDPDLIVGAVASALGIGDRPGQDVFAAVVERLSSDPTLLVADNLEQVVEGSVRLSDLLSACPDLRILATSRERLRLRGEHLVDVPPLAVPSLGSAVDVLSGIDSVRLFVERCQALVESFAVDEGNAALVAQICSTLEGMPLALELAAASFPELGLERLLEGLERTLDVLTEGARDLPPRQRSLRAAIEWSYGLLTDDQRAIFDRVSVFRGGFTVAAAEDVTGVVPLQRTLFELATKSLLTAGEGRFVMLEPIRQLAAEHLESAGLLVSSRDAHARHYASIASACDEKLKGAGQQQALAVLETESDNLRAALDHAPPSDALGIAADLVRFWTIRGRWSEGRGWYERLLANASGSVHEARARLGLSQLARSQGDYDIARDQLERSCALAERDGDDGVRALVNHQLGELARIRGDIEGAEKLLTDALEVMRSIGDERGRGIVLTSLGNLAFEKQDFGAAVDQYTLAAELLLAAEDETALALVETNRGYARLNCGDPASALVDLESAIARYERAHDDVGAACVRFNVGVINTQRGDVASAVETWTSALTAFEAAGDRGWEMLTHQNLAIAKRDAGDYAPAERHLVKMLEAARSIGDEEKVGDSLGMLADLATRTGDLTRAEDFYERFLANRREADDRPNIVAGVRALAELVERQGRVDAAVRLRREADELEATAATGAAKEPHP